MAREVDLGVVIPSIGSNGNWYVGTTDLGKPSRGVQGAKGDTGAQGEQGIQGPAGKDGTGVNIKGSVENETSLPGTGTAGDAYLDGSGTLWVYVGSGGDSTNGKFKNAGNIKGPKGDKGDKVIKEFKAHKVTKVHRVKKVKPVHLVLKVNKVLRVTRENRVLKVYKDQLVRMVSLLIFQSMKMVI